jgi:hypothetical protein
VSTVFHEHDEPVERDLFERRARVQAREPGVPSLDAVLRLARNDSRETSSGRGRAWTGLALAAACLVTVVKTRPHDVSPSGIAADVDGSASGTTDRGGGICEEQAVSTCTLDSTYASMVVVAPASPESRACVAPPATFESLRTLSCDRDEANRTEMP